MAESALGTHRTSLEGAEKACDRGIYLHLPRVPTETLLLFSCSRLYLVLHLHSPTSALPPCFLVRPQTSTKGDGKQTGSEAQEELKT